MHAVNPKAAVVQGIAAYASVLDVPGDVEVAFIAVPADSVIAVTRECASERGSRARGDLVGVRGDRRGGLARQSELLEMCRDSGMRLIGPNCMGVVNTDPDVLLNGTFATTCPPAGRVGFLSQSGALGSP